MDELFTRYMYFIRAKKGIKSPTTEALRKFYEKDCYVILKNEEILQDLILRKNEISSMLKRLPEITTTC